MAVVGRAGRMTAQDRSECPGDGNPCRLRASLRRRALRSRKLLSRGMSMSVKHVRPIAIAGLLLVCLGHYGCGQEKDPEEIEVGGRVPSFSLTTYDRTTLSSHSFAGQIVVLNFWSTGCAACVKELPELQEV